MIRRAPRWLWLVLGLVTLATACDRRSSEEPASAAPPAQAAQQAQALSGSTCDSVAPTGMAPGWKVAPIQAAGQNVASTIFPASVGERAILILQESAEALNQEFKTEASLNGVDWVAISRQRPLAARVVQLSASNRLELETNGGVARTSVAALSPLPCAAVEARVTHAGGSAATVETRTFTWPMGAGPALLVVESGSASQVTGRVVLGSLTVQVPAAGQLPVVEVVSPQASNTLRVEVGGSAGAWVRAVVVEPDMLPPIVSMGQPAEGAQLNASPVEVQGTAGAGAVAVKVGAVDAVLSQGQYTAQVPLVEGPNALVAEVRDQCGNVARVCRPVVLTTAPPTVVIEGVTDGQVSREPLHPTWTVTSSGPVTVEATLDGAPFVGGTAVTAEGSHELRVMVRDAAGREAQAQVGFAIDTTPPRLTLTGVEEGERRNTPAVLGFTVEEEHPGSVEATLDGAPMASGDTVSAEGAHVWTVAATDAAGNRSEVQRHFVVDVTAPTLEVLSPAPGSFTQAGSVEVVVAAADDGPVAGVWLGNAELTLGTDGKYRSLVVLEEGSNLLVLVARDAAGNSAQSSLAVTRDSTPPQLTLTTPAEGAKVAGDSVQVEGQAQDTTPLTVRVAGMTAAVAADGHFQLSVAVAQGPVSLEVVATDAAGNTARLVRGIRVNTTPPRLDLTAPASGTVTEESSIEVSGFARAADRTDTVRVEVAGTEHGVRADGSFSVQVPLEVGLNTVSVTAVDGYGLRTPRTVRVERQGPQGPGPGDGGSGDGSGGGTDGGSGEDTPDAGSGAPDAGSPGPVPDGGIPSEPPVLVLASPQENSLWGVERVSVLGRVEGGDLPLQVTVDGLPAAVTGRQFSASVALPEGSSMLHVRAVDALGRIAEVRRQVRVDQTPPFLEVTRPEQPSTTVSESPYLVEGLAGDAYLAGVTVNGAPVMVLAGHFSSSVALVAGDNTVEVEAVDLAGNRSRAVRTLRVEALPPQLTVLEPVDGSEATEPVVRVTVKVESSAPLDEVRIGTGIAANLGSGQYTAQVPLALGENVIPVSARDTLGMTGSATVRVRYRDPSTEPLTVTGVDPSDQATELEPDTLVNVAFNKAVKPASVRAGFTVSVEGQPLAGGWSVAHGAQIVSFIARDPLPEGATLQVRVAGVEPVQGPGMQGEFRSMFTVRRPLTRLRGQVVDARREPVSGVRVEVEGQGLFTRTGADGNWALFGVQPGQVVLRYEGGASSEGQVFPTVRRRFAVEAERDNEESTVVLTPVDAESAEPVDTSLPLHLTFGGRHGALEVDIPAGGLILEGGSTRGLVTLTQLPLHSLPVPTEGALRPVVVWQLQPAGTRLVRPVVLRLPNRLSAPPGSRAALFTYDPEAHRLHIAGLATLSADGTQLVSDGVLEAGSLEYFGYLPLPEESSVARAGAVSPRVANLGPLPRPPSDGLIRPLTQGFGLDPGSALAIWDSYQPFIAPAAVMGTVRGPREQAVALDLSSPSLGESRRVALDSQLRYRMPLSVQARSLYPLSSSGRDSLVLALEGVGPEGQRLGPPSGGSWRQESPQGQRAELSTQVELSLGTSSLWATGTTARGRNVLRLNAELSLADGGVPDGGATSGLLRVQRGDGGSAGGEDSEGLVRFAGMPVRVTDGWHEGGSISGPAGRYAASIIMLQSSWIPPASVLACVRLPIGWNVQSWVAWDGRVRTRKAPSTAEECSGPWEVLAWPSPIIPDIDVLVDVRWLHGNITFVDRQGEPLPPPCSDLVVRQGTEVTGLSQDAVRSTEVHFFREDNLSTPIVSYAVADPEQCDSYPGAPHGRYAKVRYGPSTLSRVASRRDSQRLLPGDRLVVFAVNHATGYSGMEVVTVPSVNQSSRAEDGSCPADDAAGGPMAVQDGSRTVSVSRCTLQDLGIEADLKLYPPEIDVRVERQSRAEGSSQEALEPSLVRHKGAATTRDNFVSVATHWRVRRQPARSWDPGVLPPVNSSCEGGSQAAGSTCAPQILLDEGPRGTWAEHYCGELPEPRTPEQQALCLKDDRELAEVPVGVPPLAGRVVRITGSAVEEPAVASFHVAPGRSTTTVQTALRRVERDGREVVLNNLTRAYYYVQVVGHPVLPRDRNSDGTLDPSEENAPPPDFEDDEDAPGIPEGVVTLKSVYRSVEPEGRIERYDRALEHEFRVMEVGSSRVTARTERGEERPLPQPGQPPSSAAASPEDVAYQFLLNLLEPEDPGRTGPPSSQYVLRLGTDSFGIECPIELNASAGTLRGTCEGEYLPEVLSAGDVLYLEVYLRGNAENVLYRFNFDGLSMREDYLGASSRFTAHRAVEQQNGKPVEDRPISRLNEAHFFLSPHELSSGRIRLCTNAECSGDGAVIKDATVLWTAAGSYAVSEQATGSAPGRLVQEVTSGAGNARHLRLGLPASVTAMPGIAAAGAGIFLVKDSESPPRARQVERLGTPKGRFQGLNAQAPGQEAVAGINVADLHLALTHTDFAVPQLAGEVSFSRTYANQNDLPSPMGVGWRHELDGFVLEESLGRYVVNLGGQAWGFIRCTTVDEEAQTASGCMTDKTHGMSLKVDSEGVQLTTEQGSVYRFNRPAVKRDQEGRRKWLLTKFHDGHGRGEQDGWTHLTYAEGTNRLTQAKRTPGELSLELKYCEDFSREDCDGVAPDAPGNLKFLARSEGFKLLKGVVLKNSQGQELHIVRFKHDRWGNLLEAERTTDPPTQKWKYTYAPIADDVPSMMAWRAINELSEARLEVAGHPQWVATYGRGGAECYAHLEAFECVSSVTQTGFMGNVLQVQGEAGHRQLKLPTGNSAEVSLNEYGNVTSSASEGQAARRLTWPSSQRGGEVRLEKSVSPSGRTLRYGTDHQLRLDEVKLEGSSDVVGLEAGALVSVLARDARGLPTSGKLSTANGPAEWSMPRSQSGDVLGLSLGGTQLFSRVTDEEGRITSERDALGNTTTFTFGALGLPVRIQVSSDSATSGLVRYTLVLEYDAYGRLIRRFNETTGEAESWRYDGQGNMLEHTLTGEPSERWTYTYTYGDQRLTVVERLEGTAYTRTALFEQGLLKSEQLSYGTGNASRAYEYEGGRLKKKTDELSVTWEYTYDSAGRLKVVKANGRTVESYGLDEDGILISTTDREGHTTQIGNDSLGRPVSWTYEDGYKEEVRRDAQGAIVWEKKMSPGADRAHVFAQEVDALGQVLSRRSAENGSGVEIVSTYDAAGRVRTREDRGRGLNESFEYGDVLGRLTRYQRTVASAAGSQNWIETRQYVDEGGRTELRILRQIDTGLGPRQENQVLVLDALGRVLKDQRLGAGVFEYTYDARGNVLERRHSVLGTTSYTYDGLGNLLSMTEPGGVTTTYTVDAAGRVLTQEGPHDQERWTFTYDLFDRPLTQVLAQAGSSPQAAWSFEYPGNGIVIETDPLSIATTRRFNSRELLLSEERGSQTAEYAYDGTWPRLHLISHEGSERKLTRSFDDLGRPLQQVEFWKQGDHSYTYSTTTAWTGRRGTRQERWEATDASVRTLTATIRVDGLGNLIEQEQGGLTDAWAYDAAGLLAREALAGRPEKRFFYEQDRLVRMENGSETTLYEYDAAGRQWKETDPSGRERTRVYNAQGLVASERFGAGETLESAYTYDRGGGLRTLTRGGAQWNFTHGPRGELQAVELPGGLGTFTYQYDALLQLKGVTPPEGGGAAAQTFAYDNWGRQLRRTRGSSVWSTAWQGGLSTTSDPNGDVVEQLYDGRGRVVRERFAPGNSSRPFHDLTAVTYAYDGLDQLLLAQESRISGAVSNVYDYDGRSRLISMRRGSEEISYTYTESGQKRTVTSPSGTLRYEYDAQDRVRRIESSQGPVVAVGWEPGGLLSEVSGNGVVERYAYWGHGLIRSIASQWDGPSAGTLRYEYGYDVRGNRLEERYTAPGATAFEVTQFGYDAADRLTGVRYPTGEAELYLLAADGSRLEEKHLQGYSGGLTPQALANATNATQHWRYAYDTAGGLQRIDDVLTGGVEAQVTTDAGGRVVAEMRGGTTRQYGWDAGGRLASTKRITAQETVEASYAYGFDGLRRTRTVNGVSTRYVWGANEELLEEGPAVGSRLLYAQAGFGAVAAGGERLLRDALGSVVGRVGPSTELSRYGAWGALRQGAPPQGMEPSLAYAGQSLDSETGLSYAQQRWYSSETGRFLSEDPLGAAAYLSTPTELNPWLYARSNPLTYLDPSGLWSWSQAGVGLARAGRKAWHETANAFSWAARPLNGAFGVSSGHYDKKGRWRLRDTGTFKEEAKKQLKQIKEVAEYVKDHPVETVTGLVVEPAKAIGTGIAACVVGATTQGVVGDEASRDCGEMLPKAIGSVAGTFSGAGAAIRTAGRVRRAAADMRTAMRRSVSAADDMARTRLGPQRGWPDEAPKPARAGANDCAGGVCQRPGQCFVAGTPVLTQEGLKPIEQIVEGELVWSRNEETGQSDWRPVVRTFVTPDQPVLRLELTDEAGQRTVLGVTGEHPFWVKDLGWVGASSLLPGQQVASAHGGWLKVGAATWEQARATVFNFEVEEFHTYFVGDVGAWVHNSCQQPWLFAAGQGDVYTLLEKFRKTHTLGKAETFALAMLESGERAFGINSGLFKGRDSRIHGFEMLREHGLLKKATIYSQEPFLLHAEALAVIRLWERLQGKDLSLIRLYVDNPTCKLCLSGLPRLQVALGIKRLEIYGPGTIHISKPSLHPIDLLKN
ncbi:polymorphic toxin-type HINT domain-containing protein [Hyalangium minutum]|uniref:Hint domain-containing protein n=1 Tax=Hyalangium minutum TaxID=394096 RepID=A0A085WQT7_9BACT|nr:polymorphic toxin-type HINT domain-containing protein [Hyalangium minutum]KFE70050.1 hypothetical protein DB31_5092 [Hyalangium minutum]